MRKDIKLKKVDNIVNENYISKIGNIVENVRDITLEVKVEKYKIFELKDIILTILHLEDKTGKICALLAGNRNDDSFKKIINYIGINGSYRVRGSISSLNEDMYEDLDDMLDDDLNIKDYLIGNILLSIKGIQNISEYYRDYEKIELFGVDITTVYDFDLEVAYNFVNKNTDYLKDISIDEVKNIKFSANKDIIILLRDGTTILNGKKILTNISILVFMSGLSIFTISNDHVITCLIGNDDATNYINNNNYKYKKILITPLIIVALTYDKDIRLFGSFFDKIVDYQLYSNIDDIGYVEKKNDIVVIKDGKTFSLFHNQDYSNNNNSNNILLSGYGDDYIIIDND